MKRPCISIIIPSLNQGRYIGEAIESVLDQQYPDTELLVVDGGSSDHTIEVIRHYRRHINWWVSEADRGQSDAINKGLARATGDIVNWLNSDDILLPGAFEAIARAFEDDDILCVCGVTRVFGAGQERSKTSYVNHRSLQDTLCHLLVEQPAAFFRKRVFDELDGPSAELHYVMDRDLWIRFLGRYGLPAVACIETPLAGFRHHENSKTTSLGEHFSTEYAGLLYHYCHDPVLRGLLQRVAGDSPLPALAPRRDSGCDPAQVDAMVVFFLLKYARDLAKSGRPELSRQIIRRVDLSAYSLDSKAWKWIRQQRIASGGRLAGYLGYLWQRYLG